MIFNQLKRFANRITSVSCPIAGIQWTPSTLECQTAEAVMAFLAQRRVFYNILDEERATACWFSVNQIRQELTKHCQVHGPRTELGKILRAMNRDCRKFVSALEKHRLLDGQGAYVINRSLKDQAIIQLRLAFGRHVARMVLTYGIDVEDELAIIIPFDGRRF